MAEDDIEKKSYEKEDKVYIGIAIGAVVASIIIILVLWICYYWRLFIFTYCAQGPSYCIGADYILSPDEAKRLGYLDEEIFEIRGNELYYTPPRRTRNCQVYRDYSRVVEPRYLSVRYQNGKTAQLTLTTNGQYSNDGGNYLVIRNGVIVTSDCKVASYTPLAKW